MQEQLDTVRETLLQPISEAKPCGEDPKYEEEYDQLKQEMAKLGGMGIGSTDWVKVEEGAVKLLESMSKELNLCVYLVAAWMARHQLPGMVVGMELVTGVVNQWWETMFPPLKRLKPRRNAFTWLHDRMAAELANCKSEDRALVERGIQAAKDLKAAVYERFDDPPCNFRKVIQTLDEWLLQIPEPATATPQPAAAAPQPEPTPEPAPQPAAQQPAPPPAQQPPPAAAPAQPARPARPVEVPDLAEDADAEQLLEVLAKTGAQLHALAPQSPTPYLLLRLALWENAGEPRSDDSGETFFPAPAGEQVNALENMYKRASWPDLLNRAEDLTQQRWYWLDLQYFATEAAEKLEWTHVAAVIKEHTYNLDRRLPRLKDLKFNDGKPFANSQTRDWLSKLTAPTAGEAGEATVRDPGEALLSDLRSKGSEAFAEAMAVAQESLDAAPDRRTVIQLKLAAARFCMEVEQTQWAADLLESMIGETEAHNLAWWDPKLAAGIWRLMYEAARSLEERDDRYREWKRRARNAMAANDLTQTGLFPES